MRATGTVWLITAAMLMAGAARAEWAFQSLGRDAAGAAVARFVWEGEGGDLDGFPFREACEEVAGFLSRLGPLGGAAPAAIVVVAEVVRGERLRLTRRLAQSFELADGRCVGEGAGVAL